MVGYSLLQRSEHSPKFLFKITRVAVLPYAFLMAPSQSLATPRGQASQATLEWDPADRNGAQVGVKILKVNSFSIRGSGKVDGIKLRQTG